jgi:hypothetical protein
MKTQIKAELSVIQRFALTTDLWTSSDQTGYMVVTAHYINPKWEVIKQIIGCKPLSSPHTGEAISNRISQTLLKWNLLDKCAFITVDNASSNDLAVKRVKKLTAKGRLGGLDADGVYFHLRCAAHVINLVVKDGLGCITKGLHKLRSSVKYIRGTPARKQAFDKAVEACNISFEKKPASDVATRWNSTFLMIETSLPFKLAFENLSVSDSSYTTCPTQDEWLELTAMRNFLELFYKGEFLSSDEH